MNSATGPVPRSTYAIRPKGVSVNLRVEWNSDAFIASLLNGDIYNTYSVYVTFVLDACQEPPGGKFRRLPQRPAQSRAQAVRRARLHRDGNRRSRAPRAGNARRVVSPFQRQAGSVQSGPA